MHATRPAGFLRLLIPMAALGLLAGLLFLPAPAQALGFPPFISEANVDGTSLELLYHRALDTGSVPAASAYGVKIDGGTAAEPSSVSIIGSKVKLTLASAVTSSNVVTVDYTVPSTNRVQDLEGTPAASDTNQAVTNNTSATNAKPAFSTDTTTRAIQENSPDGTNIGAAVTATAGDSDTLTYSFGDDAISDNFEIDDATGQLSVDDGADLDHEDQDTYVITVFVTDSKSPSGGSDSVKDDNIAVTITIVDVNEDPDISGNDTPMVDENTTTVGTYTVTDEDDGATHTWSVESDTNILGNEDGALFEISTGGVLSFITAPDFENPTDDTTDNYYDVRIKVTDNGSPGLVDTFDINVQVEDVNEGPTITTTGTSHTAISKAEGTMTSVVLATYQASVDPEGDTLTWSVSGADAGDFTIVGGELKFRVVPDYESPADSGGNNTYTFTVNVRDGKNAAGNNDSAVDDSIAVTVIVTNVNEPPDITTTGNAFTAFSEPEGTAITDVLKTYAATDPDAGANLTWTLSGDDGGDFSIVGGQLKFRVVPDFESPADANTNNVYTFTVNVRDGLNAGGGNDSAVDDSVAVMVTVTNVDETGTASFSGTLSGGETQTASLTDPDGDISNQTYQWQRGNTAGGSFSNISGATSSTYVPVAADVTKYLKVRVNYTDGFGSGRSATSSARGPIGASNAAPTFNDGTTATRTLVENPAVGTNAGNAIAATDTDRGDTLVYAIKSGGDGGSFTIDSSTGQLKSKSGVTYNFEATKNSYTVVVTVHDGKDTAGGASTTVDDEITVTINLTNVNEEPDITSAPATKNVPENSTAVHTFSATDVDAMSTFTWDLLGADDDKFSISQTGVLTFSSAPDFETPTDNNMDNMYVVSVRATDNGSPAMNDVHTVTVTVTNVNEAPTITSTGTQFTAPSFDENLTTAVATYTATDVDADTSLTWSVEENDFGDFNITKNADGDGVLTFKAPPNYEMPADADTTNTYSLTVKVRDNHTGNLSATLPVVVTVNDVNEAPVITGTASPNFPEIEFDVERADLTAVNLTVPGAYTFTDDDGDDVSWSLSGDDSNHFNITEDASGNGVLTFKNPSPNTNLKPADFENPVDMGSGNTYEIVVQARDNNSLGPLTGTFDVTVTVTNVDETPEITTTAASHTAPSFMEIEYDVPAGDPVDLTVATYAARDEEGQAITWSKSGTDASDFTLGSSTGILSFAQRPNFEMPADDDGDNVYNFTVTARDTASHTRDLAVTVTVTNVDETPQFRFESTSRNAVEIEYDSGTTAADLASIPATSDNVSYWYRFEARDEEGQDIIWSISGLNADLNHFVIAEDTDFMPTAVADESAIARWNIVPNFEDPKGLHSEGSGQGYAFTVSASDGTNTSTHAFFVLITDVNEKPEFTGTPDLTITYNENATINVADYDARDEEGGVTWSVTDGDSGDFNIDADGVVTFKAPPDYEDPKGMLSDDTDIDGNVYAFTVVATDVASFSPRRDVRIDVLVTVADVEEDGTITVDNLTPAVGDTITFTLADPDGGIALTPGDLDWNIQTRTTGGAWQNIQSANPLLLENFYIVDEDDTGLEIRAVVSYTDRRGSNKRAESEATAAVTADPIVNAPPRFTEGQNQSIPEGNAVGNVGVPVQGSDRDNDSLTYGIQPSLHSDLFEINPSTGQLRALEALDFETTSGALLFTVTLHDGKDEDGNVEDPPVVDATTTVSVFVQDVEEDGVVTLSSTEPEVGTPLSATLADGDGGVTGRTWQWARSENGTSGWAPIAGAMSSTYTPVDADGDFFLRARVEYTDRRGAGKSAEAITDGPAPSENRRPTFPSTETGQRTVPENTRAGSNIGAPVAATDPENNRLTYSLSGTDAASFTIASNGQLRLATGVTLDFETKSSYSVTVEVHDGRDGSGETSTTIDDTQAVRIMIENVEELGVVTLSTDTGTIQARVPVTATLEDDDGPTGGVTWQWSRSVNGRTNWFNIAGATSPMFTPTLEEDARNYIRATASYTDGHGPNKTANAVSPRVGQPPPVNSAPAFPSTENGQREVPENAGGGTNIGDPVAATDLNAGDSAVNDPLAYSLTGTDAASFTIDEGTGQIRLASGVELDYEGKRTYRLTVEVTDGRNQHGDDDMDAIDDRQNVTITVTNVNEAPVVTGEEMPSFQENSNRAIATYTGTDPERDALTWSVSGNDFWISSRGQLYFRTPPSFEGQTSYTVTVTATDDDEGGNLSGSLPVTVTVTDAEEEGVVTITPPRGWGGPDTVQRRPDRRRRRHYRRILAVGAVVQRQERLERHRGRNVEQLHGRHGRPQPVPAGKRHLHRQPGQQQDGFRRADDPCRRRQAHSEHRTRVHGDSAGYPPHPGRHVGGPERRLARQGHRP